MEFKPEIMMTDKDDAPKQKSKCDSVKTCDKLKCEKLVEHLLHKETKTIQDESTGLETLQQHSPQTAYVHKHEHKLYTYNEHKQSESDQTANVKKINFCTYNEPNQKVYFLLVEIIIS